MCGAADEGAFTGLAVCPACIFFTSLRILARGDFMSEEQKIPLGLGMALAQNQAAMERFALLPEAEKQGVIAGASQVQSREEMRQYAENIGRSE